MAEVSQEIRNQFLAHARRQLDSLLEEARRRAARSAARQQELHDWIHGRTDRLPDHFDRALLRAWGFDPDKPYAEQDE